MSGSVSKELLSRLQPLSSLGESRLEELAAMSRMHSFPRNSDPFRAGHFEDRVVYLVRGELKIQTREGGSRVLVGGYDRAAAPVAHGDIRPQNAFAITDVQLLSFDEDALDTAITWNEIAVAKSQQNNEGTDWRLMSGMFAATRITQGAFANLPSANIERLLDRFTRLPVKRGDAIIRQAEVGDFYYLIEKGRCKVERTVAGGGTVELAELTAGDAFGEEALVAGAPRNATVTMKTDGVLLRLAKADFFELLVTPLFKKTDYEDACRRVEAGAIWLDVRFPAEFVCDSLPNAINIPLNDIRKAADTLDRKKEYVVYCQTGRRSSAAAFLLSQRGFNAVWLEGGMNQCAAPLECVE